MKTKREVLTHEEWLKEGRELFGKDPLDWKFECILCGHVQTGRDFLQLTDLSEVAAMNQVFMSCIGRWVSNRGCDWTLGGLLQIHTREVLFGPDDPIPVFQFYTEKPASSYLK